MTQAEGGMPLRYMIDLEFIAAAKLPPFEWMLSRSQTLNQS